MIRILQLFLASSLLLVAACKSMPPAAGDGAAATPCQRARAMLRVAVGEEPSQPVDGEQELLVLLRSVQRDPDLAACLGEEMNARTSSEPR